MKAQGRDEQVEVPVVVGVKERAGVGASGQQHARVLCDCLTTRRAPHMQPCFLCHILERSVAKVAVQHRWLVQPPSEHILQPITVEVSRHHATGIAFGKAGSTCISGHCANQPVHDFRRGRGSGCFVHQDEVIGYVHRVEVTRLAEQAVGSCAKRPCAHQHGQGSPLLAYRVHTPPHSVPLQPWTQHTAAARRSTHHE